MSTATYVSQPTIIRIPRLLEEVRDGTIQVPRFQRPPVWDQDQRIALLESIRQGIPIGSLLIWRTRKYASELAVYPLGPAANDRTDDGDAQQYVLDGHQRLTTLFMVLGWGLVPADVRPSVGERASNPFYGKIDPIYYDLEHERFEGPRGRKAPPDWWLPLDELFDDFSLYELITEKLGSLPNGRALINRARSLHKIFYDFQVAMIPVSTDDLGAAITSFERANTAGTKMSEAHMVSAMVYTSNIDVNDELTTMLEELDGWTDLESKYILAVCKASLNIDLFNSQTERLTEALKHDHELLARTKSALVKATELLAEKCDIWGPETLPYSYQLVFLADVLEHSPSSHDEPLRGRLSKWVWVTTYTNYFASISSTRLRETLEHLRGYAVSGDDNTMLPAHYSTARYSTLEVLPPQRFDFRAARSRALALMMAAQQRQAGDDSQPHRLLASAGRRAMTKLLRSKDISPTKGDPSEGFENRFIADPQHANATRQRIREAKPEDAAFLLGHGIDDRAAAHLRAGEFEAFLAARRALFLAQEQQFVESLGLTYIEEDER